MKRDFIQQEDKTVLNVYTLNHRASKYMKQKMIKLQTQYGSQYIHFIMFFSTKFYSSHHVDSVHCLLSLSLCISHFLVIA